MSGNNKFFQADCRHLNRKVSLTSSDANRSQAEKLLKRVFPRNHKAPPLEPDLPVYSRLARVIGATGEQIDWKQNLREAEYVAFDTETTGLHPYRGDEIIAIGAVYIKEGRILEEPVFHQLVDPRRPISPQSKKITGITEEMLQGRPHICAALLGFLEFAGPRILVAHNASFDLAFMNMKIGAAIGTRIVNPVIDTVLLASALYPSLGDYSLENLASRFKINLQGRHSALGDARIAAALFLHLLPKLFERKITTLGSLAQLFVETGKSGYPLIF